MMKIIFIRNVEKFVTSTVLQPSKQQKKSVELILENVQKKGDQALKRYEKKFNGATISSLRVSKKEITNAYCKVSKNEIAAINQVKKRLTRSESTLKNRLKNFVMNFEGVKTSKSFVAINSVGCYVPGGLAQYPSSAVMSIIPAKIAGVKRIVVTSPPNKQGMINPLTLVASDICGATEIYKTSGAQAIAALSYGTQSISPVEKIVGPGGMFVTLAKYLVSNMTSIDMLAGPTELGIIADDSAQPNFIAVDLISQAEHSPDTCCFLITCSLKFAKRVKQLVNEKITTLKRSEIIKSSLEKNGFIAICKNNSDVIRLANKLAPEHLEIITKNPKAIAKNITTPGLILIGKNTPSSASDYLLGSNHILPTNRFGRSRGSLSVFDFVKLRTEVETSKKTLEAILRYMNTLTNAENLPNHYEAVRSRLY